MVGRGQHGMTQQDIDAVQARYGKGPNLAADLVVLTAKWGTDPDLRVLLIERGNKPYRGWWALPGGFIDMDEDLEPAARRELREETGVIDLGPTQVEQLGAFGHPLRDPRSRVVSVVYMAWVPWHALAALRAGDDAAAAKLVRIRDGVVEDEEGHRMRVGFDHDRVLGCAWRRARTLARHTSAPLALAPETVTSDQVCQLYEALAGPSNRRALLGWLQHNGWIQQVSDTSWRVGTRETCWERPAWQSTNHTT